MQTFEKSQPRQPGRRIAPDPLENRNVAIHPALKLQRAAGNTAVTRLLGGSPAKPPSSALRSRPAAEPGGAWEEEADRAAEQVVRGSKPPAGLAPLPGPPGPRMPAGVPEVLRTTGRPIDPSAQAEVDRQFWDKTKYRPGQKLGTTADDRQMAEYWKILRDEMLRKRQAREATAKERRTIETRLYGLEELYRRYRSYLSMRKSTGTLAGMGAVSPQAAGASLGSQPAINRMRAQLDADLITAGFPGGIADFETFIHDYEKVFERETLAIARVMLDQYQHLLWTEEQRYKGADAAGALHEAVRGSGARAEYETAEKIRAEHAAGVVYSLEEMQEQAYWVGKRNEALARGEALVRGAAAGLLTGGGGTVAVLARTACSRPTSRDPGGTPGILNSGRPSW